MKVLISDNTSPRCKQILEESGQIQVDVKTGLKPEELVAIIGEYDGLVVRSATKVTPEIIEAAGNMKVIGRAGSGVDNINLPAATKRGIVVMNTPGGNTITTAEHAVSMMLAVSRLIPQATMSMKSGKWEKKKFMGKEVFNKTLGIVGLGQIGKVVADRALGLSMKVIAYDPYITEEAARKLGVEAVSLDELLQRSDYISIHVPATAETKNIINADAFAKMKDGVILVNCARGGLVNENDLAEAIKSGKVLAAAVDVYDKEPPPEDHPLLGLDQVICTPHLGASTDEAQVNVAVAVAKQIADYLVNGTIQNAVNVPSVSSELLTTLRPYLALSEKMGSFYSQLFQEAPEEISIEYSGDVAEADVSSLTISLLKGLLTPIMEENVNYVNATVIAKERGIRVLEAKSSLHHDFASMIVLKVTSSRGKNLVAGALFGKNDYRIVRLNNFYLEAIPEGHILALYNKDVPGVIGKVGTLIGENNINIGRMVLGREKEGNTAVALLHIDEPASEKVLKQLKSFPEIIDVKQVNL